MVRRNWTRPRAETCAIARALQQSRRRFLMAGLLSGAINILALTGPLYMLEVYNGVLPSGSVSKLALLTLLMLALYASSGALDVLRLALMGRAALRIDQSLSARVFAIVQLLPLKGRTSGDGLQPVRDLDQIRAFLSGPGPTALFDMPWMPLYLGVIYLMHPLLGLLATLGGVGLIGLMLLAETGSAAPVRAAAQCASQRWAFASAARRNAEAIRAMGFKEHLGHRWCALNDRHLDAQLRAMGLANVIGAMIKVARPALQSSILGLGAYLVIHHQGSPGTMIAASIVLSRALAPVETAIAYWRAFVAARQAHARLAVLLAASSEEAAPRLRAAKPHRSLHVESLAVVPPGASAPVVREVGFTLQAGAGLGIVGPSASGKTTLARALVGAWQPQTGSVRLDGRPIAQWAPDSLGRHIGYLPQDIALFEGTIADNIARFDPDATEAAITAAARAAGVHEMIEQLPGGYATDIGEAGTVLSAGQRQRLGLARALYGRPFLVVLDEPNANLDARGEHDLTDAIASVRRRGGIVIVVAHRRSALAGVDTVLALVGGRVRAIGPKEAVLAKVLVRGADVSKRPDQSRRPAAAAD
jgi:ATP-binding cassette, subfamily C, type I secretion system permease/ATPase